MLIGITVNYHGATNTKGSRQKATVIMPSGEKITAYNGCYDIPVGGDARLEAALKVCDRAGLRLISDVPIHINANVVVFSATTKQG